MIATLQWPFWIAAVPIAGMFLWAALAPDRKHPPGVTVNRK